MVARREDRTMRPRVLPVALLLASACGFCAALYLTGDSGQWRETELEGGRGRQHGAGNETAAASEISAGQRLKLKAEKEDHKSRALRLQVLAEHASREERISGIPMNFWSTDPCDPRQISHTTDVNTCRHCKPRATRHTN